jgi:hypothetical protein
METLTPQETSVIEALLEYSPASVARCCAALSLDETVFHAERRSAYDKLGVNNFNELSLTLLFQPIHPPELVALPYPTLGRV